MMSLTRTTMSAMEATELACIIDKTHLPVTVKRVTAEGVVEVQDTNTGYVLPILSHDHWKQYVRQLGANNAIDEFANAGVVLLSQLDKMLEGLRFERDNLMEQAEKVDQQVTHYQTQRDAIEAAIKATNDVSLLASVRGVTVTPVQPKPHPRSPDGKLKQTWVIEKLHQYGQIRVSTLAEEMAPVYDMTKEEAIKSISSILSRLIKIGYKQFIRVETGHYAHVTQESENTSV